MKKYLVVQTDFGQEWPFVATMKGVVKMVDPQLEFIDSCHQITPFSILEASQQLNYIYRFWPENTVFVSVVDPGVGTDRKASCFKLKNGQYVISPDNGSLSHLFHSVGIEQAREIRSDIRFKGTENVSVFHGRDIFIYAAALLASGQLDFEDIGEAYEDIVLLDQRYLQAKINSQQCEGIVTNVSDHFGSIVFSIPVMEFLNQGYHYGEELEVSLYDQQECYYKARVPYVHSFGEVPVGQPLLFNSSSDYLSLGINMGNFRDDYQVSSGLEQTVIIKR